MFDDWGIEVTIWQKMLVTCLPGSSLQFSDKDKKFFRVLFYRDAAMKTPTWTVTGKTMPETSAGAMVELLRTMRG